MSIFAQTFRASARGLALPLAGAVLLCALCLFLVPQQADIGPDRVTGQWLHLPGLLLVAAALGAGLEAWPLFSRSRTGFAWVLRIENRSLHGCLAAALGCLAALAVALVLAAVAFTGLLEGLGVDQGPVVSRIAVRLEQARPFLDNRQDTLVFHTGKTEPVRRIRLRPSAFFSGRPLEPTQLQIHADGVALRAGWFGNAGETVVIDLPEPRPVREIRVRRKPGPGMLLRLPAARVEVESSVARSSLVNCILALLTYLIPATFGFAIMILGHRQLALPVNLAAGLVACLLSTLLELAPVAAAVTGFARGRWLLGAGGLTGEGMWLAGVAVMVVVVAWVGGLRRG